MLTMSHHNRPFDMYGYAVQTPPAPRQFSGNGTSSAFSASAHPDEDWTKISDLAERRRIQNRIAQRNYRKKIKAKLAQIDRESQERESQARGQNGSSSEASSSKSKSNSTPKNKSNVKKQQSRTTRRSSSPPTSQLQQQFTPPMQHDDYIFPSNHQQLRDGSHTPPMVMYSAPAYPPVPGEMLQPSYNTHMDGYRTQTGYSEEYYSQPSMTMPPMDHFNDALRRGGIGEDSLFLAPFSYGMPGIAASGGAHISHHPSPYEHMPLTPQSHYDHSAYGSEGETFEYETTP